MQNEQQFTDINRYNLVLVVILAMTFVRWRHFRSPLLYLFNSNVGMVKKQSSHSKIWCELCCLSSPLNQIISPNLNTQKRYFCNHLNVFILLHGQALLNSPRYLDFWLNCLDCHKKSYLLQKWLKGTHTRSSWYFYHGSLCYTCYLGKELHCTDSHCWSIVSLMFNVQM